MIFVSFPFLLTITSIILIWKSDLANLTEREKSLICLFTLQLLGTFFLPWHVRMMSSSANRLDWTNDLCLLLCLIHVSFPLFFLLLLWSSSLGTSWLNISSSVRIRSYLHHSYILLIDISFDTKKANASGVYFLFLA